MKYTDENRGKIQNRKLAIQINDFSGLRFNNITPTDIDGFIEYKGKLFIFIEVKLESAKIPFGQKLALERVAGSCNKPSIVIIGRHKNTEGDIEVGSCIVSEVRLKNKWINTSKKPTVKEVIEWFVDLNQS